MEDWVCINLDFGLRAIDPKHVTMQFDKVSYFQKILVVQKDPLDSSLYVIESKGIVLPRNYKDIKNNKSHAFPPSRNSHNSLLRLSHLQN